MSKISSFRGPFDKQHGKRLPSTVKPWMAAPLSYSLINTKGIDWAKVFLLTCQILGLLVNTLAADGNYAVLNRDNLTIPIQMQLFTNKKLFLDFLLQFWNLLSILTISKKETILTVFVFPNLRIPKKKEAFSQIFAAYLKCRFNFKQLLKKDDPDRSFIFEITNTEIVVR